MQNILISSDIVPIFYKLLVAMACGMCIGTERIIAHKTAGMRTYALVSMGAALFIIIGDSVLNMYVGRTGIDPFHITSAIITGVGFMGAGVFILRGTNPTGLTTASGLWVAAAIGVASGYGLFMLALVATLLTLFIFVVLWHIEERIKKITYHGQKDTLPKE